MKTFLTVIRHGETEWNKAMRLQGKQDSNLTGRGREQVSRVANALESRVFDVFISSDLGRAVQTSRVINQYHKLDVVLKPAFRERNFGVMEGLTLEQIVAKYPEVHHGYTTRAASYQIPGGESLVRFSERVIGGIEKLVTKFAGKRILLVAHGGVLDSMLRHTFGFPLDNKRNFSVYNSAINVFSCEDGFWKLEEWGNIDHFLGMESPLDEFK